MGIVVGSCMAKETSAVNINNPVYPSGRNNHIDYSDRRETLRMLTVSPGSYPSNDYHQQRIARTHSSRIPYAYIRDASHHSRGHQTRRIVHGQLVEKDPPPNSHCFFVFYSTCFSSNFLCEPSWHLFLAWDSAPFRTQT